MQIDTLCVYFNALVYTTIIAHEPKDDIGARLSTTEIIPITHTQTHVLTDALKFIVYLHCARAQLCNETGDGDAFISFVVIDRAHLMNKLARRSVSTVALLGCVHGFHVRSDFRVGAVSP